jgi:hypothetical protein
MKIELDAVKIIDHIIDQIPGIDSGHPVPDYPYPGI